MIGDNIFFKRTTPVFRMEEGKTMHGCCFLWKKGSDLKTDYLLMEPGLLRLMASAICMPYVTFPLTFNASRSPLPSRLKASTNSIIAKPGARASIGFWVMMKL